MLSVNCSDGAIGVDAEKFVAYFRTASRFVADMGSLSEFAVPFATAELSALIVMCDSLCGSAAVNSREWYDAQPIRAFLQCRFFARTAEQNVRPSVFQVILNEPAAFAGSTRLLRWALSRGRRVDPALIRACISVGNVKCLDFIAATPVARFGADAASYASTIECVKYLHAVGCVPTAQTAARAVANRDAEVLEYCIQHGALPDRDACISAVLAGNAEIIATVERLVRAGTCEVDPRELRVEAARSGHIVCIVAFIGKAFDKETFEDIIAGPAMYAANRAVTTKFLVEECELPDTAMASALKFEFEELAVAIARACCARGVFSRDIRHVDRAIKEALAGECLVFLRFAFTEGGIRACTNDVSFAATRNSDAAVELLWEFVGDSDRDRGGNETLPDAEPIE